MVLEAFNKNTTYATATVGYISSTGHVFRNREAEQEIILVNTYTLTLPFTSAISTTHLTNVVQIKVCEEVIECSIISILQASS